MDSHAQPAASRGLEEGSDVGCDSGGFVPLLTFRNQRPSGELLAVRDWRAAGCFDPVDRAALTATDELLDTGDLCDETWRTCFDGLGRDAAIETVASIATWLLISKLARGLRVPLAEGIEGWPPDGGVPPTPSWTRRA